MKKHMPHDIGQRAMSQQEAKLAKIITDHMIIRALPTTHINVEELAIEIIRSMVTDTAFDLLTGGNKPIVHPDTIQYQARWCTCSSPIIKCDSRGCTCQVCGLPG